MFRVLRAEAHLDGDAWPAIERFVHDPGDWVPRPAHQLRGGRWRSTVRLGPLEHEVRLELGEVWSLPDAWSRPVRWWPVVGSGARVHDARYLPTFTGDLTLREREPGELTLELEGHYVPPLGTVGAAVDTFALGRAAQTTVDAFVGDVATALTRVEAVMGRSRRPAI